MKLTKYIYILLLAGVLLPFFSCEMKDDLKGKTESSGSGNNSKAFGSLQLTLKVEKGEVLDPDLFSVQIMDESGEVVKEYDTYREMQEEETILLRPGMYSLQAQFGELVEAAFDMPYYMGSSLFTIDPQEATLVETGCSLGNVKVTILQSEGFRDAFKDDYTIILTNGTGVLTQKKGETRPAFFRLRNQLEFIIYGTTKEGKKLVYSKNLYDEEIVSDYHTIVVDLDMVPTTGEPDSAEPVNLLVDISLIEKEYTIEMPSCIVEPQEPQGGVVPAMTVGR